MNTYELFTVLYVTTADTVKGFFMIMLATHRKRLTAYGKCIEIIVKNGVLL